MDKSNWHDFLEVTKNIHARPTLLKAIELFKAQPLSSIDKFAIDLGCGAGGDTLELIKNGWRVLSIDKEKEAIELLKDKASLLNCDLQTRIERFENINNLPEPLLINASLSLPFCRPQDFNLFWEIITKSLQQRARFSGDFFGVRDDWSKNSSMTFHTIEQVKNLFIDFKVEFFHERDERGPSATAGMKHWHSFSVVARKL